MSSPAKPNVGKFTMSVQASKEPSPKAQDRIEAIANWLLKQWNKSKEATRGSQ